jgi:D-serine deaminase-like pyridoxal phosphate-dependent protein
MASLYDLDTPALVVDLDRMERNIERIAVGAKASGKSVRPHAKTHKCPQIGKMQIAAGAVGLTVAKVGEAEVMADSGITNLFIANQIVGAPRLKRLVALVSQAEIIVGADSVEGVRPISEAAQAAGVVIPVRIEVDTGLGRAGTRSQEETLALAAAIADLPGVSLEGLFTHEGHMYTVGAEERTGTANAIAQYLGELRSRLENQGTPVATVSVGSTPGFVAMAEQDGLDELRPGTYIFSDRMQMRMGADYDWCALTVLATVTSVRSDGRVILDSGSKSMASDKPFPDGSCGMVLDCPDLQFVGMSEEHGHLLAPAGHGLRVGDKLRVIPNHVCTCVNMHERMWGCRGETVEAEWPVAARGKIQ